jgi:neutral ceramidase
VDTVAWGFRFGDLRDDVAASYRIGDSVEAAFHGAHPRNRLQEVYSFCDVERLDDVEQWRVVLTDSHWDVRFAWRRVWLSASRSACSWFVRAGSPTSIAGRYRIRHRGYSKALGGTVTQYEGLSSVFTVADDERVDGREPPEQCDARVCATAQGAARKEA